MFDPRHVGARLDAELTAQADADSGQIWTRLRNSFVMPDCDADPSIVQWAHRYTRNSQAFVSSLRTALPEISYIQQIAARDDVPGEFVLLPWVESRYRSLPGKRSGSAGIWQIMPGTARVMGLRMVAHYDGRLDLQASSQAVMKLLSGYHARFHDWRMASYAYNAGEFATARFLDDQGSIKAGQSTTPRWPGHTVTEQHLSQILAIACVVRDPVRFGVALPTLAQDRRLTAVPINKTLSITDAANRAGMSVAVLQQFNAAFLDGVIDGESGADLLLPAGNARQFRAAAMNRRAATAIGDDPRPGQPFSASASRTQQVGPAQTHRIRSGENLWVIAHRYAVTVSQLRRWNSLRTDALQPGQLLSVGPAK
ncbi:MAG: transglycosylase SLT domain-containing protein [Rhodanobacter sp.]